MSETNGTPANYSLTRKEEFVTIENEPYVIVQGSSRVVRDYRNVLEKSYVYDSDGKRIQSNGISGADYFLISKCLFKIEGDKRVPVKEEVILDWPDTVSRAILDDCERLTELAAYRKKAEDALNAAKKLQPTSPAS
jgi:hypothetical protein